VDHIKFNLDDLGYVHHPLALSLLVQGLEWRSHLVNLYWGGFKRRSVRSSMGGPGGTYWIRERPGATKSPLVFFHGICSGWFFYAKIVLALGADRTIILYDYDCTKLNSLSFSVATAHEVSDHVTQLLLENDIEEKVTLFAHSWGTVRLSHPLSLTHSLTDSLTRSLTDSLAHSLTHSPSFPS
jgi:hypothetical protein